ncbi:MULTISPECIES: hypothetical protein [unclassified Pseudoalteromonas]|jgi:hypothetical protein|uniref:hypothetical protein n=1 Tax=unclassified Pseudoalteromonas TaxID=194690 RepID=UPI00387051E0
MLGKSITALSINDCHTRELCLKLIELLSDDEVLQVEGATHAHNDLDSHLKESIAKDENFYSAAELELIIDLIGKLSAKIEYAKQQVAEKIISKQKSNNAVNQYKANS